METILTWAQDYPMVIIVGLFALVPVYLLATHKKRRQKKLSKTLRRHGIAEYQRRFEN